MSKLLLSTVAAVLALVAVAPAAADAPDRDVGEVVFSFVDEEECGFPIDVTVERTRRTTYYANGDVKRHTQLIVTSSANGKTIVSRTSFNVFIDADSPTEWVITGAFEKSQLHGRTIWLQSGRLVYDLEADTVLDPHPGPLGARPDVCELLAP